MPRVVLEVFHCRRPWWGFSLPLPLVLVATGESRGGNEGARASSWGGGWEKITRGVGRRKVGDLVMTRW